MALYHSVNVTRGSALTNSAHQAALASAGLDSDSVFCQCGLSFVRLMLVFEAGPQCCGAAR